MEEKLLQLLGGCLKHDRHSQKLLYQEFYNFAMNICLRYTSNQYEASEVLNDGFFKAFTNLEKYDSSRPFKAWLSKIMHNTSIDYYRANLKSALMEDLDKAEHVETETSIENKLGYEDLLAMVQSLPHSYRVVFNLYEIDGYTHEEIAIMLGISTGTSRSNLCKAKQKLQDMINLKSDRKRKDNFSNLKVVAIKKPVTIRFFNKIPGRDEK
jgi:RNA polymerase sigma factor (sigma-70 family)